MREMKNIPYINDNNPMQLMDIFLPEREQFDTIVWFHGGGLENGNRGDREYPKIVTDQGYAFVSVEYRMYPTAKFPDFLNDGAAAVAETIRRMPELGGSGKIYISGESAGAYITMMLCMDPKYLEDAGVKQSQIGAFLSDSAQQFCHFNVLRELGLDSRLERIDEHAPIYFVREGLQLRPLLLMYYSDDMKCRPEETRLLYANMRNILPKANVQIRELPGQHCNRPKTENGENMMWKTAFDFLNTL